MLETKNLTKIYKPKKGVPVRALDGVSLKFPETGMVFLLGKSGSGKSTLLNVLGGLDRYDDGEILIAGQSSKTFRQQHFDSYRNTYVGFIFQEYNILDEFSVGANIALALQLQGIKPTTEQIAGILRQVDLEGYGTRKPNELSGGQKQRVAIARALVKSPKIIMADEPTGALDSATGRQILTTLKKLSADKLVIVVSHDREFAEAYADRIIELSDGQVIRDVERRGEALPAEPAPIFEGNSVSLPEEYQLTDTDRAAICDYIQSMVNAGKTPKFELHGILGRQSFQPTDEKAIQPGSQGYHVVKSKLPMKHAFKMGASGLKYKKFRLVMTILLSCVAFVLFGLADTMASYSYVRTCVGSLTDPQSPVTYAAFEKEFREVYDNFETWDYGAITQADFDRIKAETSLSMYPVYSDAGSWISGLNMNLNFSSNLAIDTEEEMAELGSTAFYRTELGGYVEITEQLLADMGGTLVAGSLPRQGTNEIAVSTYVLDIISRYGYQGQDAEEIKSAQELLGKTLSLDGIDYTVSGVVDTGMDLSRYDDLKSALDSEAEFSDMVLYMAMESELRYALNCSLTGLAMVAPGQIQVIYDTLAQNRDYSKSFWIYSPTTGYGIAGRYGTMTQVDAGSIVWMDGKTRTELQHDEIVLYEKVYDEFVLSMGQFELVFSSLSSAENPDYSAVLSLPLQLDYYDFEVISTPLKIVGIIPSDQPVHQPIIVSQSILDLAGYGDEPFICQVIAPMPESRAEVQKLVEFSDRTFDDGNTRFNLMSPVSFELKALDEIFEVLQVVFMWIGGVFVIFAALLFSNFISTSISYKKREIGILRAIGSRSNDVFRIFFAESFIIAMINFVASIAGTITLCSLINSLIRNVAGLLLTVLNVGIRQVGLLLGICLLLAAAASFLPVQRIAAKRPIDAIRDR